MDIDELANKYGGGTQKAVPDSGMDVDALASKYGGMTTSEAAAERTKASVKGHQGDTLPNIISGTKQGVNDIANSVGTGIGFFDQLLNSDAKVNLDTGQVEVTGKGAERNKAFQERVKAENKTADENITTGFGIGRVGGQIAATAPFMPARALKAIDAAQGALPTINAAGFKEAAPVLNRLGASVNKGAIVGGEFGALTSASNDKSLPENIATGVGAGAVGGPLFEAAGIAGKSLAGKLAETYGISKTARLGDLNPTASKYVLDKFKEAGLTPDQVKTELARLGPKATIADLDPLFLDVAEAVAKSGGTGSSMMKTRFAARGETADNDAATLFEQKLGGKPDLDIAKQRIVDEARRITKPDYEAAHNSSHTLDTQPIIESIDNQLKSAVGSKATMLGRVKNYLYRKEQDAAGNDITVPKYSVKDLHEVRQGLDDLIEKSKSPTTSAGKNALRAIQDVRSQVDAELKTNPEMASADTKFAQKMDVLKGIDIGKDAFSNKVNYEQFAKTFNGASDEVKDTIRTGMRANIGDMLEGSSTGELSKAQKLFEKNSTNRAKFQLAFGNQADDVLDAIHKQLAFRRTERTIEGGSRTAQIQAIQQELGVRPSNGSMLGELVKGGVQDIAHGSGGLLAGYNVVKRGITSGMNRLDVYNIDNKVSGAGDILSRQGQQRDNAVNILTQVSKIRDKRPSPESLIRLPVTLPVALTESIDRNK